jgi:hypothetical protein
LCSYRAWNISRDEKSEKSKAEKVALKNLGTRLSGNATGPVVHTWRNKSRDLNVRAVGTP